MLSDDRFRSMFEDKEFARDEEGAKVSSLYLLTNLSGLPLRRVKRKSHFQTVTNTHNPTTCKSSSQAKKSRAATVMKTRKRRGITLRSWTRKNAKNLRKTN